VRQAHGAPLAQNIIFADASRSLIAYFAWLVCSRSHTIGTWVDGFFSGAGLDKTLGDGDFSLP